MALLCECGNNLLRLLPVEAGAEAQCTRCGRVNPNSVLRDATKLPEDKRDRDSPTVSHAGFL
jgi:hypothetical protein